MDISKVPQLSSFKKLKALREVPYYPAIYTLSSAIVFSDSCDDFEWMVKALTRFENLERKVGGYTSDIEYDVYPVYKFVYRLKELAPMPVLTYLDLVVLLESGFETEETRYAYISAYYRLYSVFTV